MTGAMYAAIAGLRTHMQNLNVIGNNVANVNTYGYKSARSVFNTALYTTVSGGSDGTTSLGGSNPSQIGYGVSLGSVGIDMSTGNYAVTGRPMDWMLDGDGFFVVGEKTVAKQFNGTGEDQTTLNGMNLTRVGNFEFGEDGYLAKENDGMCVYGFQVIGYDQETGKPIYSDQLVPIRYPSVRVVEDGADKGKVEIVYPTFDESGHLVDPKNGTGDTAKELDKASFMGITIDKNTGIISGTCKDTGDLIVIGCLAVGQVVNPNGVTNLGDNYYQAGAGSGGLTISTLGAAAQSLQFYYGNTAAADGKYQSKVAGEGTAVYMNGSLRDATQGATDAPPNCCRLISAGKTRVLASGLEMSKTDLAQEISQMILTQRGYQANTRIVTVTDSMLEELVNMKR